MPFEVIRRPTVSNSPKNRKGSHRMIVGTCDYCNAAFERKYQKSFVEIIQKRGYIGCSMKCGAHLREQHMTDAKRARRKNKRSIILTERNLKMHANMSSAEKIKRYAKISKTVRNTYAEWSDEQRESHRNNISRATQRIWDEDHDNMVRKQIAGYKRAFERGDSCSCMSKAEIALGDAFEEILGGKDEVIRQEYKLGKAIDIYLPSRDLYIEVDGRYWHGLNMPLKQLIAERHKSPRSRRNLKTFISDRRLDNQFKNKGVKLIRVVSEDVKVDPFIVARNILKADMSNTMWRK